MSWFKKKYSVCSECQAHFEPATGEDAERWPGLCPTHRKPVKERDIRKNAVMSWARQNWEKLEPQYLEESKSLKKSYQEAVGQGSLASWATMQNEAHPLFYSGLAAQASQQRKSGA